MNRKSYEIKEMLTFSNNFQCKYGIDQTGEYLGIVLKSAYRNL